MSPGLPVLLCCVCCVLALRVCFLPPSLALPRLLFGNRRRGHRMLLCFILGGADLLLHVSNLFVQFSGVLGLGFGIVMTFFELLVQFLQAFIFTLLAALYISDAVSEHH